MTSQTNIGNLDVITHDGYLELRLHNQVPGVRSSLLLRSEASKLVSTLQAWLHAAPEEDLIG